MKKLKLWLFGGGGLLLAGALTWWLHEPRIPPNQQMERSLSRAWKLKFWAQDVARKSQGTLAEQMAFGLNSAMTAHEYALETELVESGYYSRFSLLITNFQPGTEPYARSEELYVRVWAAGLTNEGQTLRCTGVDSNGAYTFFCRTRDLPEYIKALSEPCSETWKTMEKKMEAAQPAQSKQE